MGINYYKEMEKIIENNRGTTPTLLLHSCCAPCSTSVIEYLSDHFRITVFYFNPNITERDEYEARLAEQKRFLQTFQSKNPIDIIEGEYAPEAFLQMTAPLSQEAEGGKRCEYCYRMRLQRTAAKAKELGYDYFTTTLTVSPLKNAEKINAIGADLEKTGDVSFLYSDFKKKNGYQRSVQMSNEYGLYRQNYCGCNYSKSDKR